jgi:hypothetical protein
MSRNNRIEVDNSKWNGIDVVDIEKAKLALKYSILADQPVNLIGAPGIGKSAITAAVARELSLPLETMILSLCDPTDIGGFPVTSLSGEDRKRGSIDRFPMGTIKRACDHPVILFLDELSCAPPAVQGAAMRLVYERWAGDEKLHPDTRVITAMNPPDQAAGGWEVALPLIGRMTQLKLIPRLDEVKEYFYALGVEKSKVRELAIDLAATLEAAPELIVMNPPAGAAQKGENWGAPRSWERAIMVCAKALESGERDSSPLFAALLAGNVGETTAAAYMTIRKIRDQLPTVKEIRNDPEKAKLPDNTNAGVGVIGVLVQVAMEDPCPAWIYCERLQGQNQEIRVAASHALGRWGNLKEHKGKNPLWEKADKAQTRVMKTVGNAMAAMAA